MWWPGTFWCGNVLKWQFSHVASQNFSCPCLLCVFHINPTFWYPRCCARVVLLSILGTMSSFSILPDDPIRPAPPSILDPSAMFNFNHYTKKTRLWLRANHASTIINHLRQPSTSSDPPPPSFNSNSVETLAQFIRETDINTTTFVSLPDFIRPEIIPMGSARIPLPPAVVHGGVSPIFPRCFAVSSGHAVWWSRFVWGLEVLWCS